MKTTSEAVVIGGGVIGCSIAYQLTKIGMKDIVLLEKDAIGYGSSGRSSAVVRNHYSNRPTTEIAWKALQMLETFDEGTGENSGFVNTGYIISVPEDKEEGFEHNLKIAQDVGVDTWEITPQEACELHPLLNTEGITRAAYERRSGYADPHGLTQSFANLAKRGGCEIKQGTKVTRVRHEGGKILGVDTDKGAIDSPIVIDAAGPWSRGIAEQVNLQLPLRLTRQQIVYFQANFNYGNEYPVVKDASLQIYFRAGGNNIALCGSGVDNPAPVDPDSYKETADTDFTEKISGLLAKRMPQFADAGVHHTLAGLYTVSPDWNPILDRSDEVEGFYYAVGFSGHGFKLSPMVGLLMAELIAEGGFKTMDASPFGLRRFREGKSFSQSYGDCSTA